MIKLDRIGRCLLFLTIIPIFAPIVYLLKLNGEKNIDQGPVVERERPIPVNVHATNATDLANEHQLSSLHFFSEGIPHNLFFTYKTNILETKEPKLYYDNIQHTINMYSKYWAPGSTRVRFVTDDECRSIIFAVEKRLVPYFDKEPLGKYRADICRVAALYQEGGYYFDIDIEVLEVLQLNSSVSFSTSHDANQIGFFQAFIAAKKAHPVLKEACLKMLSYYENRTNLDTWMGPSTLKGAFYAVPEFQRKSVLILKEVNLDGITGEKYSKLNRPESVGKGCCCNYVVSDPKDDHVYFWSRVVGSGFCK